MKELQAKQSVSCGGKRGAEGKKEGALLTSGGGVGMGSRKCWSYGTCNGSTLARTNVTRVAARGPRLGIFQSLLAQPELFSIIEIRMLG